MSIHPVGAAVAGLEYTARVMESKSTEPGAAAATPASGQNERKSMMPVVAGVGVVLAVIAAIALWPKSEAEDAAGRKRAKAGAAAKGEDGEGAVAASGKGGGVAARSYDEPKASGGSGKINPAIRLPNVGMAPEGGAAPAEDDKPPAFANTAEEIAWYEKRLVRANKALEARKKFYDRLPEVRERLAAGPDPQRQLETFEGRKKIVEENYAKAQADVAEIEVKLKALRGG